MDEVVGRTCVRSPVLRECSLCWRNVPYVGVVSIYTSLRDDWMGNVA